jgi:hypothetical protein
MADCEGLFREIAAEIEACGSGSRLVMFGADLTGNLVYEAVKRYSNMETDFFIISRPQRKTLFSPGFDGIKIHRLDQVTLDEEKQTVVLCAHPHWYDEMTALLRKHYKKIAIVELLKNPAILEGIDKVYDPALRVDERYRDIKVIVESQPKSGTTWLTHTLIRACQGVFASTFNYQYTPVRHAVFRNIHYRDWPGPLVVLSHFFKPVNQHEAARLPVVYPIRYIIDGYYSWGLMRFRNAAASSTGDTKSTERGEFFLSADSPEWRIIKPFIPANKSWLEMIKDRLFLRYEDWVLDKTVNIEKIRTVLPDVDPYLFNVRHKTDRTYFTGDYRSKMDKEVFEELRESFDSHLRYFWPEKADESY